MKKKKTRIKKSVYIILTIFIIIFIAIFSGLKYYNYINSNYYKLKEIGYKDTSLETMLTLEKDEISKILKLEYNETIVKFIKQEYFIFSNLDRYLKYYKENKSSKLSYVVSIVNVKADNEWYDEDFVIKTDINKGILMLVNKFNHLDELYSPNNITEISNYYSYANNSTKDEVYKAYKNMWNAAKKEELTLIVTSSYRDYKTQDYLWNNYADSNGDEWADTISARAGFSEHQSGLALDIVTYNTIMNDFENTDEFKWLEKNAHKYGFILRYPKDKKNITGYDYESWHYRYVGEDVAKAIHKKNITFDEYYAYYIEGQK